MAYSSISAIHHKLSRLIVFKGLWIVLTVLILWQLASGITIYLTLSKPTSKHVISSTGFPSQQKLGLNKNLATPFFGEYVPNDIDVKESRLNLKVVGILFSSQERQSFIIIHTEGAGDKSFHVGDSLPGGAIIKRINPDGVLVERNGALESLSLPKNELIFEAQPKPLVED